MAFSVQKKKCDPAEARTQDPNIKSVVLYQLSYGIKTNYQLNY